MRLDLPRAARRVMMDAVMSNTAHLAPAGNHHLIHRGNAIATRRSPGHPLEPSSGDCRDIWICRRGQLSRRT